MKSKWIAVVLIIAALISGCAARTAQEAPAAPSVSESATGGVMAPAPEQGKAYDSNRQAVSGGDSAAPAEAIQQMVIKNADINMAVVDPAQSLDRIISLANEMGGFVVSSNLSMSTNARGEQYPNAYITIRVPAERLDEAMSRIKGLAEVPDEDILSQNISGQDVTSEYTDLGSRLKNLEATHAKLESILDSATKPEDALNVLNQMTYVTEQIEVIKGQMKYYEQAAAMSAISVSLVAKATIEPVKIGTWEPQGTALKALQTLIDAGKWLVEALIWIVILVLPIGLVLYGFVRLMIAFVRKLSGIGRKPRSGPTVPPQAPPAPPQA